MSEPNIGKVLWVCTLCPRVTSLPEKYVKGQECGVHPGCMKSYVRKSDDRGNPDRRDYYGESLKEIATRPRVELNPDGVDQAAYTMALIACETLGIPFDAAEAKGWSVR